MKYLTSPWPAKPSNQQWIREENAKWIFNLINRGRDMSRAELTRATGLSPTTVSALVDALTQAGLVAETGLAPKMHSGRKAMNLAIIPGARQIPVFSLARLGVRYTLFDLHYQALETLFVPFPTDRYGGFAEDAVDANPDTGDDYPVLFESILRERTRFFDPERAAAVCVSHPGLYLEDEQAFSLSALHVSFTLEAMARLQARVGVPMYFGNSSTSLAYAEKKCLAARGEQIDHLIYLNVCEGVGAGIVTGGEIFTGADNTAGEIGHVSIDYRGRQCACGNRGCLERYVNTDAVIEAVRGALHADQGEITLTSIGAAYDAGEPAVVRVIDEIAAMLFAGMYSAVCLTGVKHIVIGGGMEQLGDGFLNKLISFTRRNRKHLLMRDIRFTYPLSGPSGDSVGIAQYFIDKDYAVTMPHAARLG